jgi:hypothetical protein
MLQMYITEWRVSKQHSHILRRETFNMASTKLASNTVILFCGGH